jgi:hypothetical protein
MHKGGERERQQDLKTIMRERDQGSRGEGEREIANSANTTIIRERVRERGERDGGARVSCACKSQEREMTES